MSFNAQDSLFVNNVKSVDFEDFHLDAGFCFYSVDFNASTDFEGNLTFDISKTCVWDEDSQEWIEADVFEDHILDLLDKHYVDIISELEDSIVYN